MDYAGLLGKFRVNRKLTESERNHQLKQKMPLDVRPHYQMSVIKMNSTFLESVDKWYGSKGGITGLASVVIAMCAGTLLAMLHFTLTNESKYARNDVGILIGVALMMSPVIALASYALLKESFSYTHYPIRFNRANRMVYVFRTNGTVLSIPWDNILFTLSQVDEVHKFWNILGHVLSEDKSTVLESFALSKSGRGTPDSLGSLRSHWEFVRRYMEEGPQEVTKQVQFCLPISNRKESVSFSLHRLLANTSTDSPVFAPILLFALAFELLTFPFRIIAMRTSKIPHWPPEIEAQCQVAEGDPFAIEGADSGERVAVYPTAADKNGVRFVAVSAN